MRVLLVAAVAGLAFVGTVVLTGGGRAEDPAGLDMPALGPTSARPFPAAATTPAPEVVELEDEAPGGPLGPLGLQPLTLPDADLPLDGLVDDFLEAAKERYGDPLPADLVPAITEQFVYEEAVQVHLRDLDEAERADALAELRRRFGFPEAAITRAADLDARREAQWRAGLAYTERRNALTAAHDGEAPQAALDALRTEFFGRRAGTIAREEARGFYRFERRRTIGRN